MNEPAVLTNPEIRKLKSAAQRLKPILKIGKNGVTPQFVQSLEAAFAAHELIKIRFDEFKEEKNILARDLATKTALARPFGIAFDRMGNLYVADTFNNRILEVVK